MMLVKKITVHLDGTTTEEGEMEINYIPQEGTERPKTELEKLQEENKKLTAKIDTLTRSNQMLEDCVVEMAGIVYA